MFVRLLTAPLDLPDDLAQKLVNEGKAYEVADTGKEPSADEMKQELIS